MGASFLGNAWGRGIGNSGRERFVPRKRPSRLILLVRASLLSSERFAAKPASSALMVEGALRPAHQPSSLSLGRVIAQRGASMGGSGLSKWGLPILLAILSSAPAGSAEAFATMGSPAAAVSADNSLRLTVHFSKVQSFYCYPKLYWWFYRPYTTAPEGNARC